MGGGTSSGTGGGPEVLFPILDEYYADQMSRYDHGSQAIANAKIDAVHDYLETPPSSNRIVRFLQKLNYRHNLGLARVFTRGEVTFEVTPPKDEVIDDKGEK